MGIGDFFKDMFKDEESKKRDEAYNNDLMGECVDLSNAAYTADSCADYILTAADFIDKFGQSEYAKQISAQLKTFASKIRRGKQPERQPNADSDPRSLDWSLTRAVDYLLIQGRNDEAKILARLFIRAASEVLGKDGRFAASAWDKYGELNRLLGEKQMAVSCLVPTVKFCARYLNQKVDDFNGPDDYRLNSELEKYVKALKESGSSTEENIWKLEDYKEFFGADPVGKLKQLTDGVAGLSAKFTKERQQELFRVVEQLETLQKNAQKDKKDRCEAICADLLALPDPVL